MGNYTITILIVMRFFLHVINLWFQQHSEKYCVSFYGNIFEIKTFLKYHNQTAFNVLYLLVVLFSLCEVELPSWQALPPTLI